ncbi:MAG: hypothetical protein M1508_13320 [Nitrospirae bacterium]|nr:hypothetical protein [Nitrospirota bacterium]MCL5423031.1 hypothetical protein [Nitrospirota bacterium]
MNDEEKDQGANNPQQDSGDSDQNKPQSYGTEPVQKSLNPSKSKSYGTVRLVGSKTSNSNVEESNE